MQVNNHNTNNSTAFGMYYSKATVKSLKKIILLKFLIKENKKSISRLIFVFIWSGCRRYLQLFTYQRFDIQNINLYT